MASTRATIVDVAMRLFAERGFDDVTIAEIATVAGVSERTVYRYFPAKQDLVVDPDELTSFVAALDEVPASVPPLAAIAATVRRLAAATSPVPVEAARTALITTTPALHAAWVTALGGLESELRRWLARRTDRAEDDVEIVVAVAALVGVHRVLVETWGRTDLDEYVTRAEQALRVLGTGLDRAL